MKFICTKLKRETSVAVPETFQPNESEAVGVECSNSEVYCPGGAVTEGEERKLGEYH